MIIQVFAVLDRMAGYYGNPFFMASAGEARRAFSEVAGDMSTQIGRHPGDFALYYMGEFDNISGEFHMCPPEHLVGAVEALARRNSQPFLPLEMES